MSFYLSNTETGPTGLEPLEFLDDPELLETTYPYQAPVDGGSPGLADGIELGIATDPERLGILAAARLRFTGRRTR